MTGIEVRTSDILIGYLPIFQMLPKTSLYIKYHSYEGCSNMNASSFITFGTYMLRQNGIRFYKVLYMTFKFAPDLKNNTVYLSSYSPLNKGYLSILTISMLRTYNSDIHLRAYNYLLYR